MEIPLGPMNHSVNSIPSQSDRSWTKINFRFVNKAIPFLCVHDLAFQFDLKVQNLLQMVHSLEVYVVEHASEAWLHVCCNSDVCW